MAANMEVVRSRAIMSDHFNMQSRDAPASAGPAHGKRVFDDWSQPAAESAQGSSMRVRPPIATFPSSSAPSSAQGQNRQQLPSVSQLLNSTDTQDPSAGLNRGFYGQPQERPPYHRDIPDPARPGHLSQSHSDSRYTPPYPSQAHASPSNPSYNREERYGFPVSRTPLPGTSQPLHHSSYTATSSSSPNLARDPGQAWAPESSRPSLAPAARPDEGRQIDKSKQGPLIWTGTHFLPRFIKQEVVPGEGLCYFYDDGTHCKAFVDGEPVVAHWGVTKAGKPRKRLAVACLTCREKKIKCDPDFPKCLQCDKFGRECQFKNAPRGISAVDRSDPTLRLSPSRNSEAKDSLSGSDDAFTKKRKSSVQLDRVDLPVLTPARDSRGSVEISPSGKKRRQSPVDDLSRESSPVVERRDLVHQLPSAASDYDRRLQALQISGGTFSPQIDPYQIDPSLVTYLLDLFLTHVNSQLFCMFPTVLFREWVVTARDKTPSDIMLVYSVLMMGTLFSDRQNNSVHEREMSMIARSAVEARFGKFSLQLVQSRLLLSLYSFARNNPNDAWEHCGSAIRSALAISLNVESAIEDEDKNLYNLQDACLVECRRRTFWSAYLIDRFNGYVSGRVCLINDDDVFLRLPCDDEAFQSQQPCEAPMFDTTFGNGERDVSRLSPMAHLVEVACLWGMATANLIRMARSNHEIFERRHLAKVNEISAMLDKWASLLPSKFAYSETNLALHRTEGTWGVYLAAHCIFYTTKAKIYRYGRIEEIDREVLTEDLRQSFDSAKKVLSMLGILCQLDKQALSSTRHRVSTPFVGYAILSAADIICSRFFLLEKDEIFSLLQSGMNILDELKAFWHINHIQRKLLAKRIGALRSACEQAAATGGIQRPTAEEEAANDTEEDEETEEEEEDEEVTEGKERVPRSRVSISSKTLQDGILISVAKPMSPPLSPFNDLPYVAPEDVITAVLRRR